jgi:anti-anti-sigma regulatory factor
MNKSLDEDLNVDACDSPGSVGAGVVKAGVGHLTVETHQKCGDRLKVPTFRVANDGDRAIVTPNISTPTHSFGEFGKSVQDLIDSLVAMEEGQSCGCLVLDLVSVTTLVSDSVAKLVHLQKILKRKGGSLVLRHLSSAAKETLDYLKLSKSFVIEEEAAPVATPGETIDAPAPVGSAGNFAAAPEGNDDFVYEYAGASNTVAPA